MPSPHPSFAPFRQDQISFSPRQFRFKRRLPVTCRGDAARISSQAFQISRLALCLGFVASRQRFVHWCQQHVLGRSTKLSDRSNPTKHMASPPCCWTADWCRFKTGRDRGGSGNRRCDARVRRSPYRGDSGRSQPFWPRARQRNGASIHRRALHERGKLG